MPFAWMGKLPLCGPDQFGCLQTPLIKNSLIRAHHPISLSELRLPLVSLSSVQCAGCTSTLPGCHRHCRDCGAFPRQAFASLSLSVFHKARRQRSIAQHATDVFGWILGFSTRKKARGDFKRRHPTNILQESLRCAD